MKGHATIELTDMITGRKEIHEDDNLVTNALSWLLNKTCGILCNNPVASAIGPDDALIKACTGGIFLFKEPLEEDENTLYAPNNAVLVGCGSGISYTGQFDIAGSYNEIESGYSDDKSSYKHVWDFNTSQANGLISCVCLTTQAGGKITPAEPYYYPTYNLNSETMFVSESVDVGRPKSENNNSIAFKYLVRADESKLFELYDLSTRYTYIKDAITVNVYDFNLDNSVRLSEAKFNKYGDNLRESVSITMPEGLIEIINIDSGGFCYYHAFGAGHTLFIDAKKGNSNLSFVESQGNIPVWRVDLETFESDYVVIKNKTPTRLRAGDLVNRQFAFGGSFLLAIGEDNKIYKISLSDDTDYSVMKNQDGTDFIFKKTHFPYPVYHAGKVQFSDGEKTCIVDFESDTISYRNEEIKKERISCGDFLISEGFTNGIVPYIDPCILVTINNLQTPVTKTASQSMKITYTIEFGEQ